MEELKEKKCFKCQNILPITDFYKHKKTKDGYLNKCKKCTKCDIQNRQKELKSNPEWVLKEKNRSREKYHKLGYKGKYKQTKENKRETIKKYNQKYPEKALARKYTEIFLDKNKGFELHHWSYKEEHWLDVVELDIKTHNFIHRFMNYDQTEKMYRTIDGVLLNTKDKHLEYLNECKLKYNYLPF